MKKEKNRHLGRLRGSKLFKILTRLILFITIAGVVTTGSILYFIFDYAKNSKPQKSDVMIVLGCQIWGNGPSLMLEYRLKNALELYKEGYAQYIIVSGGQGKDENFTEALIMKEWLKKKGINESKIIVEENSTSSFENIKYSKKIMDSRDFQTAVIVSNDFHIFRSLKIADRLKIEASGAPSTTVDYLKFYYYSREILAVIKSFLLDR